MRKLLISLVFITTTSLSGYSQYYIDFGISAGASNYLGEFGGGEGEGRGFVADMEFGATRLALGGFIRYRVSPSFAVKGSLNYIQLTGDDQISKNYARRARNLNFKNDIYEFLTTVEYYIYKVNDVGGTGRYRSDFNLYLYTGLGAFYSDPKGQNATDEWVSLRGLNSEGKSYSPISIAIPLGIGFYYTVNKQYRIGMEIGYRTTFTDNIDDISGNYANNFDGITNKTSQGLIDQINSENGVSLGDREFILPVHFDAGSKRGNPDSKDSYLTATINFSYAIRGRSKFYKARYSWIHGNRRKNRRSRPKF